MNIVIYFILAFMQVFALSGSSNGSYFVSRILDNGDHYLQLKMPGLFAVQTTAGPYEGSPSGLVLRQVSNGQHLVNLIYNGIPIYLQDVEGNSSLTGEEPSLLGNDDEGLSLRECTVVKTEKEVEEFLSDFKIENIHVSSNTSGVLEEIHRNLENLPQHFTIFDDFAKFKSKCFSLRRKMRKLAKKMKKQKSKIAKNKKQNNETEILVRAKRSVQDMTFPYTKWCGQGSSARKYAELGALDGADACCRMHDMHCPYYIQSFQRKYGYFHFNLGTISHCACDRRFKTCLKQSNTGASSVIGNVFFSIIQSKCFVFEKRKVCRKRMGPWKCHKWGFERQAVIREPIVWNRKPRSVQSWGRSWGRRRRY